MREDEIHYAVRQFLRGEEWMLVAGQYPNGSDDELPTLNVKDPAVARDDSPDPRRHALDKFVPDLIALKEQTALVVEMKPAYDAGDEQKLKELLSRRFDRLVQALEELNARTPQLQKVPWRSLRYVPTLGFCSRRSGWTQNPGFAVLLVENLNSVSLRMPVLK
jgi:hypothetical protein